MIIAYYPNLNSYLFFLILVLLESLYKILTPNKGHDL